MNSLLENEDLVDVTLAVEGKYLKAHKMVLSVCSPYFRELFKMNPCKHPIVFMKDVSYIAMSDLLQFMYQGEVQVSQENLTTFIKTAEALQIKGLTGDGNVSNFSIVNKMCEKLSEGRCELIFSFLLQRCAHVQKLVMLTLRSTIGIYQVVQKIQTTYVTCQYGTSRLTRFLIMFLVA
jgi:hypothetical protein